jgi:phosphate starvation-inducible protein PhoH
MAEDIVMTNSNEATSSIFGSFDKNIKMIESAFDVRVSNRNQSSDSGDAIVFHWADCTHGHLQIR